MSFHKNKLWIPSRTLLAAYADGEFEGRDDLHDLKRNIEAYLTANPNVAKDLAKLCELRRLWSETTPPEPSSAQWDRLLPRIDRSAQIARQSQPNYRTLAWTIAATAACIAVAVLGITWFASNTRTTQPAAHPFPVGKVNFDGHHNPSKKDPKRETLDMEPLDVASMEEVEILSVDGKDIQTLVVGQLPLQGALELADPGEVTDVHLPNDANDIVVSDPTQRPMIWARVDY